MSYVRVAKKLMKFHRFLDDPIRSGRLFKSKMFRGVMSTYIDKKIALVEHNRSQFDAAKDSEIYKEYDRYDVEHLTDEKAEEVVRAIRRKILDDAVTEIRKTRYWQMEEAARNVQK